MDELTKAIKEWLMKSFVAEGHKLTGALVNDAEVIAKKFGDYISIEGWMYKYGAYLERGVSASKIPYRRGSGAGSSKYIDGLINYVKLRMGVSDLKRAKSIAFAIANKQKQVGMPIRTRGAGTGWLTKALEGGEDDIMRAVSHWASREMDIIFENFFTKQQQKFTP